MMELNGQEIRQKHCPYNSITIVCTGSKHMSSRLWFWSATVFLASAAPISAQAPSPLELARGIREAGMPDLALEYLKEIENSPLSDDDKKAIPLERAKCQLDSAEDEPDEGTRTSMVGEAKDGFRDFLNRNPNHPRAAEASIALAKLTSIDAKIQLNRAKRIEVGDDTELKKKQEEESAAARPLFLLAAKLFADAAQQIKAKLADPALDPGLRATLTREAFEADLAGAMNQYNLFSTFLGSATKDTIDRATQLDKARDAFAALAKGPLTNRTVWIAKAWMAETLMEQSKLNDADAEFKAILAVNMLEAEEGKRIVRYLQIRRAYFNALSERTLPRIQASEKEIRGWLTRYGGSSKPTPETITFRFYLAYTLQMQADFAVIRPKTGPFTVPGTARRQFEEAEKIYRILSQTDNDYTTRASKNRMYVVRMVLGEAEKPASEYSTFETAQMAALIQSAKLTDGEKEMPALAEAVEKRVKEQGVLNAIGAELKKRKVEAEIKHRKIQILALLERARELATDKDSPADVTDNLLRLVYFYKINDQPHQAAVLGEYIAKSVKSTGGKAASAGLLGLVGYVTASARIKVDPTNMDPTVAEAAEAARKGDRDRATTLARYLDEKFPNDIATDAARHQLASMLLQDKKLYESFEIILKIRPGYSQIASVRLLEGYIAAQLIVSPPKELPQGGKSTVFIRSTADLNRVAKPAPTTKEEEVRDYLSVRARLGALYLLQPRVDSKQADAAGPGYEKALAIADEMMGLIPSFECFKDKESGKLSPAGLEMNYLALDLRTRAVYLRGKTFVDAKEHDFEKAAGALEPVLADIEKTGPVCDDNMKQWLGDENPQKVKVAGLAQSIDKVRRDIVMLGFKLRVRQGKPAEATKMLELLVKAGGTIEDSQATLESMARDLAIQIGVLKKGGQAAEAKSMGEGLAILLKRLGSIPNLNSASILFLGQTLYLVDQYEDALKEFAKIPVPVPPQAAAPANPPPKGGNKEPNWWEIDINKLPNNADKKKFQEQIRDYRITQLFTGRSLRGMNKYPDGEKLFTAAIGTGDKPGYAYSSIEYRRELAFIYEAKGASSADAKVAKDEWGKALKEWTTLFNFAKNEVSKLKDADPEKEKEAKSRYFDTFYEIQRCLILANMQLLKGNPKLADTFTSGGKKIADLETANKLAELEKKGTGIISPEVWNHYCDLLDKYPELKNGYKAAGGKFFLERPNE
jgi:hypothetical protein